MKYFTLLYLLYLLFLPMRLLSAVVETVEGIPVEYSYDTGSKTAIVKSLRSYKYVNNDEGGITIVNIDISGTITIPKEIEEFNNLYTVVKIGDNAFSNQSLLTEIKLPETITQIGNKAFYQCASLQTINIDAVTTLGAEAFSGCSSLQEISIPNSITKIKYNTFRNCSSLTSVELPNGLTQIESEAFGGCMSLNNVILPNTLTNLSYNAFSGCSSLSSIEIPQGISSIENSTFYGCSSLTTVVANGVEQIGNKAFEGCSALSYVTFPNVKGIGEYAFSDCTSLAEIIFPSALSTIGKNAFSGCTSLESIKIPDNVVSIGNNAFSGCTGLKYLETGKNLSAIDYFYKDHAFKDCTNLTTIDLSKSENLAVASFDDCISLSSILLPDNIQELSLSGCESLESIELPNKLQKVGLWGKDCLKSLIVPSSTTSVSVHFNSLINIELHEGIETLNLEGCESLKEVDLPSTLREFSLYECFSLESLTIPEGVTQMGNLWRCRSLKTISIPSTMESFGNEGPFTGCSAVTDFYCRMTEPFEVWYQMFIAFASQATLHVPYSRANLYKAANTWKTFNTIVEDDLRTGDIFSVATPLQDDNLVNVRCIVTDANSKELSFGYKDHDTTPAVDEVIDGGITIPKTVTDPYGLIFNVTGIEKGAFYGKDMTSVVFHNGIKNIKENAFGNCEQLTTIVFARGTTVIEKAFTGCNSIQSVYVKWRKPTEVDISTKNFENLPETAVLYVPAGTKERYALHDVWGRFKQIVELSPISTGDISACSGSSAELPIYLKNGQDVAAVQFKLTLPFGVNVKTNGDQLCTSTTERTSGMTIMGNKDPDSANSYIFVLISLNGDIITGNEGAIMNVKLNITPNVALGDYEIKIEDVYMTTASYETLNPAEATSDLLVTDIMLGDVNGDGIINVTDAIGVVNYILKNTPSSFVEGAADVNQDGIINITDAIGIVNMIFGNGASSRMLRDYMITPQ